MATYYKNVTIYTADDETPDCMLCDRFEADFICEKQCGAEHGWWGYKRTEKVKKEANSIEI